MERIRACIRTIFPCCDELSLSSEMPLGQIEGWDSMSGISFLLELESVFGVRLAGQFLTETQTLADLAVLLAQKGAVVEPEAAPRASNDIRRRAS